MPIAKLVAVGSRKAKARPAEPEQVSGIPQKPDILGPIASDKWDDIMPGLVALGVMSPLYGDFLAMYCVAHQDLHDAMELIESEGSTCLSQGGGAYLHPAVSMKQNAIERIAKFGREFGMSASSIRDVVTTKKNQKATLTSVARKR